jgi:flagellar hook-basal body complex protein FliE
MAAPISGIGGAGTPTIETTRLDRSSGPDFADALMDAVTDASGAEKQADEMAVRFADGDPTVGIHETVIAAEVAAVKIRYAVTLKNKLLDAYRELMNTQI